MRYLIRRHPLRPTIFPPISSLLLASRPASRYTVSPDGSAQGTTSSGSLLASPTRLVCLSSSHSSPHLIGSSHRLIRFARCLLALSAACRRPLSSVPCGSSISSGLSPVPPRFPLCFPPGVPPHLLARLVRLIHLIHLHPLRSISPCPIG